MRFTDLDPALDAWLPRHGLHVFKQHRDDEVRTIAIVDDQGDEYQMWIELPANAADIIIHAAHSDGRSHAYEAGLSDLTDVFERAYQQVEHWIREAAHTRTPSPSSWDPSANR